MASVNKVFLVGNLGADPDTRYTASGDAVCNIRLATTETWKDKNSGEKREMTEWHRVVFYRSLAEIAGQYLRKGSQVYIEGRIKTRKWQDKDGKDQYTTEIEALEMKMLGSRPQGSEDRRDDRRDDRREDRRDSRDGRRDDRRGDDYAPAPRKDKPRPSFEDLGDDIPF